MHFFIRLLILTSFFCFQAFAETIDTFYGVIEVEEPVLLELIHSPAFQRLKSIHQYGVAYYTTYKEEYNRYDHSIGVFTILRLKGASLQEQIAGLLHDVSHTVFSHVGDWVFDKENQQNDYQSTIHKKYLALSGLEKILNKYNFTPDEVLPNNQKFRMLEQSLPNLCADRIDYNIQGAYFQKFLTQEEAKELFHDLTFENGNWVMTRQDLAIKLAAFSLFMTENCWGSALNHLTSRWLADAILQAIKIDLISWDDFHFGIDQDVWDKLSLSQDPLIRNRMDRLTHPEDYFCFVEPDEANVLVKFRCRGIDPWIKQEKEIVRLTSIDAEIASTFQKIKTKASEGWSLKLLNVH